ncbi:MULTISPECIES: NAD(P)-dependent oxidoreductase [Mycobacterium]|uniref:NAD(P)-binding domain-containing protein n=1 Tax=Mycobacterium syngnathidarum TaxID=1908205 RepID=A0A1Q9WAF5_9MYCO|nr:hypothetical protein BKG61_06410 [Mycobacterium syngnathidarum]OLT95754.1 hypothetical protein BKG60_15145 [Mycobacterium syngnathidarum]
MKTILVTGATGNVGRPLVTELIRAGDVVRQRFVDIGFGAEFADAYMGLLADTVGRPALVTHEVEKILGRPATAFADWVAGHRRLFAAS